MHDDLPSLKKDFDLSKGFLLLEMGKNDFALKIFDSLLKEYPQHFKAQIGQLIGGFNNGNQIEWLSKIDKLISIRPEEHELYRLKGFYLLHVYRQTEALPVFKKAYDLTTDIKLKKQCEFYFSIISEDHLGALVIYNELREMNAASDDIQWVALLSMLQENDFISLRKSAAHLIEEYPHEKSIFLFRGVANIADGDYLGAREDFIFFIEGIKDRVPHEAMADAYFAIGYCDSKLKDYTQAIQHFSEVLSIDHTRGEAYFNRGIARMQKSDPESAIEDFNQSIKLNYEKEECYFYLGESYIRLTKIDKAIEQFKKLMAISPNDPDGHYGLGKCNMAKMEINKARKSFNQCIQIDNKYANAWGNLALLDAIEDKMDSAMANARRAEECGECSGMVEVVKGAVALHENKYSECIKWCDIAIEINSRIAIAYWHRGWAKIYLKDDSAIGDLKKSNFLTAGMPIQGIAGALAALLDYKFQDAEKMFTEAIEQNKKIPISQSDKGINIKMMNLALYYFRAQSRIEQKKYSLALKDISILLEHNQKEVETLYLKAAIQINLMKYQDAEEVIKNIFEIKPGYAPAHMLLGKIDYFNHKKNSDRGLKYFLHAIEIDERLGEAYYYIGKIYSENGSVADATDAFEKADELGFADAAKEFIGVDDSKMSDPKVMVQEKNADGAKLDYVSIYIDAIKQLKISGPSPRDLEVQTGTPYKKWWSLFQDEVFIMSLKKEIKNKISWAKMEKTKKIWENADRYVDTMVDRACGRILARKSVKIDTNRKIKKSQIDVDVDSEDLAELMDEQIKADFGNKTTNYSQDNC
jgi:tetratricopeptide (TPR) repeat protein